MRIKLVTMVTTIQVGAGMVDIILLDGHKDIIIIMDVGEARIKLTGVGMLAVVRSRGNSLAIWRDICLIFLV